MPNRINEALPAMAPVITSAAASLQAVPSDGEFFQTAAAPLAAVRLCGTTGAGLIAVTRHWESCLTKYTHAVFHHARKI